ncbi:MAG: DUF499 domain-containing protein, partial [Bradyrhizobium sp.]
NAREAMRKALAWSEILADKGHRKQLTEGQIKDAEERAKTHRDGAEKAVRAAWSHIFYPVRSETPGKPFDLEHALLTARDRPAIPPAVYDKVKTDGIVLERLGAESLWLALGPIWPADRPRLLLTEVAGWFAEYCYLPKLRDKVVLQAAIREAAGRLAPDFGYADGYDEATALFRNLVWARHPPDIPAPTAVLVRAAEALAQAAEAAPKPPANGGASGQSSDTTTTHDGVSPSSRPPPERHRPQRFYGSVEIDTARPVKAFDTIFNAVVMELQRTPGAKVKLTLEIEGEAPDGFADEDVSVIRDNVKQLKFRTESTGFD